MPIIPRARSLSRTRFPRKGRDAFPTSFGLGRPPRSGRCRRSSPATTGRRRLPTGKPAASPSPSPRRVESRPPAAPAPSGRQLTRHGQLRKERGNDEEEPRGQPCPPRSRSGRQASRARRRRGSAGVRRRERRVPRPRRRRTRSSRRRGSRTQSPPGVGSTGTCEAPHRTRGSAGRGGRRDAPGNARRRPHPTPCAAASRRTRTARTSCGGPRGGRAQLRKGFMEWGNLESALSSEPPRGARASCSWKKTTRCSHSTAGSPTGAASTRTRTSGGVGGRGAAALRPAKRRSPSG